MKVEYVVCPACQHLTGLAGATDALVSDNPPDIECPHCGAKSSIAKSSIGSIEMGSDGNEAA
jgi:rubrerythrin